MKHSQHEGRKRQQDKEQHPGKAQKYNPAQAQEETEGTADLSEISQGKGIPSIPKKRDWEEEAEEIELNCPGCGMTQSEWQDNSGEGYVKAGENYCCEGCAEGTGCTCEGAAPDE